MKMKRLFCIWLGLAMAAMPLAGCQPTPDGDIVVGKDLNAMLKKANSLGNKSATVGEQVKAPEHYTETFSAEKGKLTFHIDADVRVPNGAKAGITRVTSHEITQAEVDLWTEKLFGDAPLYTTTCFSEMTKEEIAAELLKCETELAKLSASPGTPDKDQNAADPGVTVQVEGGDSFVAVPFSQEDWLRGAVENYRAMLPTAPEERPLVETTNTLTEYTPSVIINFLTPTEPAAKSYTAVRFATPVGDGSATMALDVSNSEGSRFITFVNRGDREFHGSSNYLTYTEIARDYSNAEGDMRARYDAYRALPKPKLTAEEAAALGDAFLSELGLGDHVLSRIDEAVGTTNMVDMLGRTVGNTMRGWRLAYTRMVGDVALAYTTARGAYPKEGNWWNYAQVTLFVTDDGVVEAQVDELYDMGETLCDNCKLMDFDSIKAIYKKMMPIENALSGWGTSAVSADYTVDAIEFGYTRIIESATGYNGLLVPTWTFYWEGDILFQEDAGERHMYYDGAMVINAIDGSVIDLHEGY